MLAMSKSLPPAVQNSLEKTASQKNDTLKGGEAKSIFSVDEQKSCIMTQIRF